MSALFKLISHLQTVFLKGIFHQEHKIRRNRKKNKLKTGKGGSQTGWWKCLSDGITYPLRGLVFLISKNCVPVWLYLTAVKELREVCTAHLGSLIFLFFHCDSCVSKCTAANNILLNPTSSLPFKDIAVFLRGNSDADILIAHNDEYKYPQQLKSSSNGCSNHQVV